MNHHRRLGENATTASLIMIEADSHSENFICTDVAGSEHDLSPPDMAPHSVMALAALAPVLVRRDLHRNGALQHRAAPSPLWRSTRS
jgi:hypothetical protein